MCRKPCHCGGRANLERWGWRLGGGEGGAGRARDGVKTFAQENTMELGLSVKVVFRAGLGGGALESWSSMEPLGNSMHVSHIVSHPG